MKTSQTYFKHDGKVSGIKTYHVKNQGEARKLKERHQARADMNARARALVRKLKGPSKAESYRADRRQDLIAKNYEEHREKMKGLERENVAYAKKHGPYKD